jgi:hypothetical protein
MSPAASAMEGVLAICKAFERWRRTDYVFPRPLPTLKSGVFGAEDSDGLFAPLTPSAPARAGCFG